MKVDKVSESSGAFMWRKKNKINIMNFRSDSVVFYLYFINNVNCFFFLIVNKVRVVCERVRLTYKLLNSRVPAPMWMDVIVTAWVFWKRKKGNRKRKERKKDAENEQTTWRSHNFRFTPALRKGVAWIMSNNFEIRIIPNARNLNSMSPAHVLVQWKVRGIFLFKFSWYSGKPCVCEKQPDRSLLWLGRAYSE